MEEVNDDEWEEETILVELHGLVDHDWISNIGRQVKLIGIDSSTPVLQLGRTVFSGEYKDALGTKVMFEVQPNKSENAQQEEVDETSLKYTCHTSKVLNMQRIFLSRREDDVTEGVAEQECTGNSPKSVAETKDGGSVDSSRT